MSATLKQDVMRGLKWSLLAKLLTQLFSWTSTFLVIRWLTPEDYGIVGIAMVFFVLISMFTTNGLTSAIVRESKRGVADNQVFSFSLILNIFLSLLLAALAPWLSEVMNSPSLRDVLWVLAAANPISSFGVVPSAHLQMEMRFKEKAIADSFSGLAGAATALIFAYLGFGYWSIIYSGIVMVWIRIFMLNLQSKSQYQLIWRGSQWANAKQRLVFSAQVQAGSLIWYMHSQADMMIIGKMLGVEKAGTYSVAADVAAIPMTKVSAILNDIGFSAFNQIKHDVKRAQQHAAMAIRCIAAVAFPVFLGIGVVAEDLVNILLGEKWGAAGMVMAIMCLGFPFKMTNSVLSNYVMGMGNAKHGLFMGVCTFVFMVTCISTGAWLFDLNGAAAGWLVGNFLSIGLNQLRTHQLYQLSWGAIWGLWPALLISSMMAVLVLAVDHWVLSVYLTNIWLVLIGKIVTGALFAAPLLYMVYAAELKSLLRR